MKKKWIAIAGILIAVSLFLYGNVSVQKKHILSGTYTEIESRGYAAEDIRSIQIEHSYLRRLLGYNEWRISAEFKLEPNVFFWFSYRDGKIIFEGVSSEPMMDKDAVIDYSERFKNGTLLD